MKLITLPLVSNWALQRMLVLHSRTPHTWMCRLKYLVLHSSMPLQVGRQAGRQIIYFSYLLAAIRRSLDIMRHSMWWLLLIIYHGDLLGVKCIICIYIYILVQIVVQINIHNNIYLHRDFNSCLVYKIYRYETNSNKMALVQHNQR